jgi:hypothetical protein
MSEDLQEQAYWMLLAFASGLNTHIVNTILAASWCYQGKHSLRESAFIEPVSSRCSMGSQSCHGTQ